jgi:hypothetical protein
MPERIPHLRFINPSYCLPYFWQGFFLTVQESPLHHPTPNQPVILSVSDRLAGTPDSSGRWCRIHSAQCSADHPDSAHCHPNPSLAVISSGARNPAHAGAPDSSGRWCRIHSAQCSADHPTPPTTPQTPSQTRHSERSEKSSPCRSTGFIRSLVPNSFGTKRKTRHPFSPDKSGGPTG